jgi:hypothetical protein
LSLFREAAGVVDEIKDGLRQLKDKKTRLYTLEDLFEDK